MLSVAIIATDSQSRERLTAVLTKGRLTVLADCRIPADLPAAVDVAVIACPAPGLALSLTQAAQCLPCIRLVAVLPVVTRHTVRRAIRAGAAAVVGEESVERSLVVAVQSACAGQLSIPLDFADGVETPILSSREKQILGMVVMGFTNGQVARRLFLAESTVKKHMSSIFGKLEVRSRNEAAALVLDPEQGLGLGILSISDNPADPVGAGAMTGKREETAA